MAYFLFVDESGQDRSSTPYEVLAGVAIQDIALWDLVQEIRTSENRYFGTFYQDKLEELKAKKLLKRKTFRLAQQLPQIEMDSLCQRSQECLLDGTNAGKLQITALAQAKIGYVEDVFRLCMKYDCRVFGSIIDYKAIATQPELSDFVNIPYLRKDYSYLFERYFYFLEDLPSNEMGLVIFDELERSKSHILVEQMSGYFLRTNKGQSRASHIIPQPLFVHSDLTTGVHIADLVAYCLAWGFRVGQMSEDKRDELDPFVTQICSMRYKATRVIPEIKEEPSDIWSIAVING